jgi:hypothetical protein
MEVILKAAAAHALLAHLLRYRALEEETIDLSQSVTAPGRRRQGVSGKTLCGPI